MGKVARNIKVARACRSCGKPLAFVRMALTGQWLPVDPEPVSFREHPLGETYVTAQGKVLRGRARREDEPGGRMRRGWRIHKCRETGRG